MGATSPPPRVLELIAPIVMHGDVVPNSLLLHEVEEHEIVIGSAL